MKKFTFLILSLSLMMTSWLGFSQVVIGNGAVTGQGLPIEPFYGYSYSQVIYTQAEIGGAMNIAEIQYSLTPSSTLPNSNDWVIYMGHTSKAQFNSNTDWIDVTTLTQVYSGTITANAGVVAVILDTPFAYNGTDNLVIAVDENNSGYDESSDDFYCTAISGETRGLIYRNDSTNPDPAAPPTASYTRDYIANIVLIDPAACLSPYDIAVSPLGTDANVTWSDDNDPPPYNWEYELVNVTAGDSPTGVPTGTFNSSPGILTSLTPGVDYEIYMRSVCNPGVDYSPWTSAVSWHQPLPGDICSLPINAVINTDCADSGAVTFFLDFALAQNQGVVSCSDGADVYGYWFDIEVVNPLSLRINNDAAAGTIVGLSVNLDCTSATEIDCDPALSAETNIADIDPGTYHALFWSTEQVGATELCFEEVPCMAPQNISADYVGYNSANFNWSISSSATSEWQVVETGQATVIASGSTSNSFTGVTGLNPTTDYTFMVRANCGGGTYSDWSSLDFRTTLENDRPDGAFPLYFDIGTSCGPSAITGISNAGTIDSGVTAPSCGSYGTPTNRGDLWYVFTAPFDTVTLNVENINGMTSVAGAYYSGNPGALIEEACTEYNSGWPWELTGLTPGNNYYLRVWDYGNDQDGTFDLCAYYESCPAPSDLTIESYTTTEVTFSWTDNAGASNWYYDVRPAGDPTPDLTDYGITTTSNPTTDTGLNPDTDYDVYIRTDCDGNGDSIWTGPVTFTTYSDEAADWNNLQWPPNGTSEVGTSYAFYAQIYEPGLTNQEGQGAGISAWIGYSTTDTDPETWTNWVPAIYNLDDGNNDEYLADIGPELAPGNYYVASRFKINNGMYTYGGTGGFWNNDSATLTVTVMANDACDGAVQVVDLPYTVSQDATYDTNNDGFIDDICGTNGMNDGVWYSFTVATGGDITVTVDPTGWDAELAVYSGSCGNFDCVDRADSGISGDSETLTFTALAGTTYFINIGNFSDITDYDEGPFDLNITSTNAVLGIANNNIQGFMMYPNPTDDVLTIKANDRIDSVYIYNMLGQEVWADAINSTDKALHLGTLPTGSYIVKVQVRNQVGTYSFVKQ